MTSPKSAARASAHAEKRAERLARGIAELASVDLEAALQQLPAQAAARRKPAALSVDRLRGGQLGTVRARGAWWCLQYRGPAGADGKRKQHSVRVGRVADMTRQQARDASTQMLERIAPKPPIAGATCAWSAWCNHYLAAYVPMLRPGSQRAVTSIIRCHLAPAFAPLQMHEVRSARIQALLARWVRDGAAPATIAARYRVLRRMLKKARSESYAAELPQPGDIDLPRGDAVRTRGRGRAFSMDELRKILAAAPMPWRLLFLLCAFLGLRIGEALGLRWSDIDLSAGRLALVRQYTGGKDVAPKTNSSAADLAVPDEVLAELRALRESRRTLGVYVFESPRTGRPFDDSGVRKRHLRPLLRRLGIPDDRSSHAFRHWYGTEGARAGVPLAQLGKAMRHRDLRSTQRYLDIDRTDGEAAQTAVLSRYSRFTERVLSAAEGRNQGNSEETASTQRFAHNETSETVEL